MGMHVSMGMHVMSQDSLTHTAKAQRAVVSERQEPVASVQELRAPTGKFVPQRLTEGTVA